MAYCSDQVSVWAGSLAGAPRSERSVSDHSKTRQRSIVENLSSFSGVAKTDTRPEGARVAGGSLVSRAENKRAVTSP